MINKLMIDNGFYILINFDIIDNTKVFKVVLGEAYKEDGLSSISITDDGKFLRYYEEDRQKSIRDSDVSKTFEETTEGYLNLLLSRFPKSAIIKSVDGVYVNYFNEE
jgi:hypothetical protein